MRVLIAAAALFLAACSGSNGGSPAPPPPPPPPPTPPPAAVVERAASGLSPLPAGCGGAGGTAFINAEVEPYLAVNPRDPNHLIGVWQQDRWSNGSARANTGAVSLDGGTTWTPTQAAFSECTGGELQRATDPWVEFGPDGTAWQAALATSGGSFTEGSINAMLVSRSTDGGRTWSAPLTLIRDTTPFFNDKEALTADPHDARFVYVVWDRLQQDGGGPTWLARTTDGGATWQSRAIYEPGGRSQTIGNLVRVLPDGTLVNLFTQLDPGAGNAVVASLRVIRSTDRGATWSAPIMVSSHQALGARDPTTGRAIRDGAIIAEMAAGPNGALHVVWQDARFTGARDAIAYSRSADGGLTWSPPVRVNGDPSVPAFTPQVHVRADGTIGVTYYDLRSDTPAPETLPTDFWIARSTDGAAWSETRVAGPFDILTAPLTTSGLFLGDYTGLSSSGTTFLALYVRTTGVPANPTDAFLARIPAPAPGQAVSDGQAKRLVERDGAFRARVSDNIVRALQARGRPRP